MKKIYFFVAIIFLGGVLRFLKLGEIPNGTTPDEATYIYNAYSIWLTKHSITGAYLPFSFNIFNSFSPIPIYIIASFVGLIDLTLFAARLPFAILGTVDILLIFLIAHKLFRNYTIALFAAFILAISPWHIQVSKIAYDGAFSLFFYLLGIYIFLKMKDWGNILWSLPVFFLGFYSYHGTKLFLLCFIPLLLFTYRDELSKRKKEMITFLFGMVFIGLSFLYVEKVQGVTRQNILLSNNMKEVGKVVDFERYANTAPTVLKNLLSNKMLVSSRIARENYLHAFSPEYLFLQGETGYNGKIYGTMSRGVMYIIELPLVLLGILYLLRMKKQVRNFLLLSLLLAPLPSAFTIDQSYGMRSIMMLPFLSIIAGCGIYEFFSQIKRMKKILYYASAAIFIFLYVFLVTEYLYQFYFRYSIYASEAWFHSTKDVAAYIEEQKGNYAEILIVDSGGIIMPYALYNKVHPLLAQAAHASGFPKKIENVSIIKSCINTHGEKFDPKKHVLSNRLYIAPADCHKETEKSPIYTIVEVGEPLHTIWKMYEN